ncbi:MAG: hypothetical protein JNL23_06060 [Chitinophagaceae bacterium]|nr:hypothetical protein [Chitinophagaceae bacterium]
MSISAVIWQQPGCRSIQVVGEDTKPIRSDEIDCSETGSVPTDCPFYDSFGRKEIGLRR